MTSEDLHKKILCGETSRVQFKQQFTTQKQIAEEMVAFANSEGGEMLFGVRDKTGELLGLDYAEIQKTTRELGNTANEHVRPTIYIRTDVVDMNGKMILVASILRGRNKPYKDLAGNIWIKQGADKRRVTENSEILALFQESGEYHPDELGVSGTSEKDLDTMAIHMRISRLLVPDEAVSKEENAVSKEGKAVSKMQLLLAYCVEPRSLSEICNYLGVKDKYKMKKRYIDPILNKQLRMTEPDSPNSPTQKYVVI